MLPCWLRVAVASPSPAWHRRLLAAPSTCCSFTFTVFNWNSSSLPLHVLHRFGCNLTLFNLTSTPSRRCSTCPTPSHQLLNFSFILSNFDLNSLPPQVLHLFNRHRAVQTLAVTYPPQGSLSDATLRALAPRLACLTRLELHGVATVHTALATLGRHLTALTTLLVLVRSQRRHPPFPRLGACFCKYNDTNKPVPIGM